VRRVHVVQVLLLLLEVAHDLPQKIFECHARTLTRAGHKQT
jgi:hypothetical protein